MASEIRNDLFYTKDHEWVQKTPTAKVVRVGITDFAQSSLGDVTYLTLKEAGMACKSGDALGSVESVKAVSDIYAPVSGRIVKVNQALTDTPELINQKPYDDAWLYEIEMHDEAELSKLMNATEYSKVAL